MKKLILGIEQFMQEKWGIPDCPICKHRETCITYRVERDMKAAGELDLDDGITTACNSFEPDMVDNFDSP